MRLIAVILMALALAACAQGRDSALAAAHVAALHAEYETARVVYETREQDLPPPVRAAWSRITRVHQRIERVGLQTLLEDAVEARMLYRDAREAYEILRPEAAALIAAGELTGVQSARLREIDRRARALDEALGRLDDSASASEALSVAREMVPLARLILLAL